jgi:hypothetical protein
LSIGNELKEMKEALGRLENENQKLTNALQSAMEDNAHMSEKLLLSEQAQESLKVKRGMYLPAGLLYLFDFIALASFIFARRYGVF